MLSRSTDTINEHQLRRLYDPHYVRSAVSDGVAAPIQVCMDSRMLGVRGGGVATYAEVLAACLKAAGASPALLADDGPRPPGLAPRMRRWLSALRRGPRLASPSGSEPLEGDGWAAADIFREAQVFFNLHGRLLPIACASPPKVMHWTYPVPLYLKGARNLYTVHDLIPLQRPDLSPISPRRHALLLRRVAEAADRLVTVSESSRAALIEHFQCAPEFVVNTYQAVHAPLQRDPPLPEGLAPGSYFLFCGSVERRKNLIRLIDAHERSGSTRTLLIVGPDGEGAEAVRRRLAGSDRAVRLPWQPRPVLLALIRQARAVCFPTLAEGFGLPVAEAMTLGAPVLTADHGALAEIAGEAALTADPLDVAALAQAIGQLDADDGLCGRLRAAGFQRARMFTPAVYAERLRALYLDAAEAGEGIRKEGRAHGIQSCG